MLLEANVDDLDPRRLAGSPRRAARRGRLRRVAHADPHEEGPAGAHPVRLVAPGRWSAVRRVSSPRRPPSACASTPCASTRSTATLGAVGRRPSPVKLAWLDGAVVNVAPEYDDVAAAAAGSAGRSRPSSRLPSQPRTKPASPREVARHRPRRRRRAGDAVQRRAHTRGPPRVAIQAHRRRLGGDAQRLPVRCIPLPRLRDEGPNPGVGRSAVDPHRPDRVARLLHARLRIDAVRPVRAGCAGRAARGRVVVVHPRLRVLRPRPADVRRFPRGGNRTRRDRPARRLPAHALLRLQPARVRGHAAAVTGRRAQLGPRDPRPTRGDLDAGEPARPVRRVGAVGGRHLREPLELPSAHVHPVAPSHGAIGWSGCSPSWTPQRCSSRSTPRSSGRGSTGRPRGLQLPA